MADRLSIYRGALRLLGGGELSSLTEVNPSRRALDEAWEAVGNKLLEAGLWNFAIRTAELSNDEDVEPLFGHQYAVRKPSDWVRTASISADQTFARSYEGYDDETQYWHCDVDPLYVRYVSNDEDYGWNVGAWRQHFADAFAAFLAFECGLPVSGDKANRNDIHGLAEKRLAVAKTRDAVDERVQVKPVGRLVQSRFANTFSRERR